MLCYAIVLSKAQNVFSFFFLWIFIYLLQRNATIIANTFPVKEIGDGKMGKCVRCVRDSWSQMIRKKLNI